MPITTARINELRTKTTSGACLSIYMQTDPKVHGESIKQNVTRLKNIIQSLQHQTGYDKKQFASMTASLSDLLDDLPFWQQQDMSLAIFADDEGNCTPIRLPYAINDFTSLGDTYAIGPLVAMKSIDRGFYLLDINLKSKPRLFRSVGQTLREIEPQEMPQSFESIAAQYEYDANIGFKGAPKGDNGAGDSVSYHGSDLNRELDARRRAYLQEVAKAVDGFLINRERPLILAGTEERVGNLRKYLKYPTVLHDYVNGDVSDDNGAVLYRKALPIVTSYRRGLIDASVKELLASKPEHIVMDTDSILDAAEDKRIDRLFVPLYRLVGEDAATVREVAIELSSDFLNPLERLVRAVLLQNGTVQAVEIDAYQGLHSPAALCRF